MYVDDIRRYASDRRNCSNYTAGRAADAVADLREAYQAVTDAWTRLDPVVDGWRNRQDIERIMALIVVQVGAIVDAADLPEEMRL